MDGYQQARKIDQELNRLLEAYPVNKKNAYEWLKLTRTVQTSADIIRMEVRKVLQHESGYILPDKENTEAPYMEPEIDGLKKP